MRKTDQTTSMVGFSRRKERRDKSIILIARCVPAARIIEFTFSFQTDKQEYSKTNSLKSGSIFNFLYMRRGWSVKKTVPTILRADQLHHQQATTVQRPSCRAPPQPKVIRRVRMTSELALIAVRISADTADSTSMIL